MWVKTEYFFQLNSHLYPLSQKALPEAEMWQHPYSRNFTRNSSPFHLPSSTAKNSPSPRKSTVLFPESFIVQKIQAERMRGGPRHCLAPQSLLWWAEKVVWGSRLQTVALHKLQCSQDLPPSPDQGPGQSCLCHNSWHKIILRACFLNEQMNEWVREWVTE